MTYSCDAAAVSELTGQPVTIWTEEWRIETAAVTLLKIFRQRRDCFLDGRKDENGKTID